MKEKIPDGILVEYNIKLLWSLNEGAVALSD